MSELPPHLTSFLGRQAELAQLLLCLSNQQHRLVTLVGVGGIGKTRMAQAVAQMIAQSTSCDSIGAPFFADGVCSVPLSDTGGNADVSDLLEEQLAATIGRSLGVRYFDGQSYVEQLQAYLATRHLLLILDSFEQWLDTTPLLLEFLYAAPQLRILVTSRAPLNVPDECTLFLGGLSLPLVTEQHAVEFKQHERPADALLAYDAVAFFCARAVRINPSFQLTAANQQAVVQICRMVDGSPLGIELAVGLLELYTCEELATEIAKDYTILATHAAGVVPRQRMMQAILDATWHHLSDSEAKVMIECSVFATSFTRDAALQITTATPALLRSLMQKALLRYDTEKQQFTIHELLRQYTLAIQHQWTGIAEAAAERHAEFYLALLRDNERSLLHDTSCWHMIHEAWPNIAMAWQWSVRAERFDLITLGIRGFAIYYRLNRLFAPAVKQLTFAIDTVRPRLLQESTTAGEHTLAQLLSSLTLFHLYLGNEVELTATATEMLTWSERLRDFALRGLAYDALARAAQIRDQGPFSLTLSEVACSLIERAKEPWLLANCRLTRGIGFLMVGEHENAIGALSAVAQTLEVPDADLEMRSTFYLGLSYQRLRNHSAALFHFTTSMRLGAMFPHAHDVVPPKILSAEIWRAVGCYARAQALIDEVAADRAGLSPLMLIWLALQQGRIAFAVHGPAAAHEPLMNALRLAKKVNFRALEQRACLFLGHVHTALGATVDAQIHYQRARYLQEWLQMRQWTTDVYVGLANLAAATGDLKSAKAHVAHVTTRLAKGIDGAIEEPFWAYWCAVEILRLCHDPQADDLLQQAYNALQAEALRIPDATMRQSFLTNVDVNRQIITAAQQLR